MGTDIHMAVERRTESGWEQVLGRRGDGSFEDRYYDVFYVLAEVRRERRLDHLPIISPPRGLPPDTSCVSDLLFQGDFPPPPLPVPFPDTTKCCYGDAELHHISWLMLDEVLAFNWGWPVDDPDYPTMGDLCRGFLDWCATLPARCQAEPKDIRLVFGFDN